MISIFTPLASWSNPILVFFQIQDTVLYFLTSLAKESQLLVYYMYVLYCMVQYLKLSYIFRKLFEFFKKYMCISILLQVRFQSGIQSESFLFKK